MARTVKFVYFDLDGTLLDHKRAEQHALHDIYHHFDLFNGTDANQLVQVYQAINSEQWKLYSQHKVTRDQLQRNRFEQTLCELGLDASRYEEVGRQYMDFYQNHWQWIDGAQSAFKSIKQKFDVGILTNGFADTQKKKFEQFNLYEQASHLVISEEVGAMKPHPSVFKFATEQTGLDAGQILYIGDSYSSDVVGGTEFGWQVAWYTQNGEAEKHKKADFVFNDFEDLRKYVKV